MQTATLVADESRPALARRADDSVLINAFGTVARQLRGPLANFLVFVELSDVCRRYRALGDPHHSGKGDREFSDLLMKMIAQAKETGDPLGFVRGMVDVARLIRRVVSLSMPIAQHRGIRLETIGPVPITLSGDQRLLLDAMDALTNVALQASSAQSTIQLRTELRLGSAAIEVIVPGLVLSPVQWQGLFDPLTEFRDGLGCDSGAHCWRLWLARLIAIRHGGSIEIRSDRVEDQTVFRLEIPNHLR